MEPPRTSAGVLVAARWSALAVVLVALDLRGPLVALASVSSDVQRDLSVSASALGLLTSIPVLCFGLSAPLASALIARAGLHRAVLVCLGGVLAGTLLRSAGGYPAALAGTVLIGLAITVGNIALPVVIGQDFPTAVGLVTALYTAALNIGSTLTSSLTPTLAGVVGWRTALAVWGVLAVLAAVVWGPVRRHRTAALQPASGPTPSAARDARAVGEVVPVWRRPGTWGLVAAMGGQAFSYYGATAWLPRLLADEQGMSTSAAGVAASLLQVFAVAGAFAVPMLLRATRRPRLVLWVVCAAWAALPLGLIAAPGTWWLWCSLAGAAQGGGFTVILVAIVTRSTGITESRRTSALVQGAGYVIGALGPTVVGAAHDSSGAWTVPMLVVAASVTLMVVAGSLVLPAREPPRRASTVAA